MTDCRLWAVVEVPQDDRVACQAPGCAHSVYKRIHVVSWNGSLQLLGSACFLKLFGDASAPAPLYGSSEGRRLTGTEHEILLKNTQILIEQFKVAAEAAREAAAGLKPANGISGRNRGRCTA